MNNKDNFIILDIETNVEQDSPMDEHFYVIQIGATKITDGKYIGNFSIFIRPKNELGYSSGGEQLTEFIKNLTHIKQEEVNDALYFPDAWNNFLKFCNPYYEFFASWGEYDYIVLKRVCEFYNLRFPFKYHINLKEYFKLYFNQENAKPGFGVKAAIKYFGLKYNEEGAHNGLIDAEMITQIVGKMIEKGFYTFSKSWYKNIDDKLIPLGSLRSLMEEKEKISQWFLNPVLVKKYKELQKQVDKLGKVFFDYNNLGE